MPRHPSSRRARPAASISTIAFAAIASAWLPAALHAQAKPTITKAIARCSPQGCRVPIFRAPSVTAVPYTVHIKNEALFPLVFRFVDDIPANALDFRVTNRGDGQPCGASGNPTCSNQPPPAGANGTGQIVIDTIVLGAAGSGLSERDIVYEVDFSCPPLTNGDLVSNRAQFFTPMNPSVCNPCLSEDLSTGGPSVFTANCQPPPDFSITKTATPPEWNPGQDPTIHFQITFTNLSPDILSGLDLIIIDNLPVKPDRTPAFETSLCGPVITTNPPAGISVDDSHCADATNPYLNITRVADIPPSGSFTLDFDLDMLSFFTDGFEFCNEAVAYYSPTRSSAVVHGCTQVVVPRDVDFRESVKLVTPPQANPGTRLTYTINATNTGTATATGVVLTDVIPACVDDSGFDPATDVYLNSGPLPGPVVYGPGRTLTVPLPDMPPRAVETLYILNLRAIDPICCNQARFTSNELPPPGHQTGAVSGPGEQTCTGPTAVSFAASTKSVTPDPLIAGQPLTYTIETRNSGGISGNGVVVTDLLPDCIDDTAFNPLTDVDVSPGPADSITYQAIGRLLTVRFASLPPLVTQTITITGLLAGGTAGTCCNQAFIYSDEVPPVGDPTSETPGAGDPTCAEIDVVTAGCDLHKDVALTKTDVPALYDNLCPAPADPRLGGDTQKVLDVVTDQVVDTTSAVPASELSLYQLSCNCVSFVKLYKDPGNRSDVKIQF